MSKRKQPLRDGRGTEHQKPGQAAAAAQGTSDSGGIEFKNGRWQVRFRRGGKRERHELFVDGMPLTDPVKDEARARTLAHKIVKRYRDEDAKDPFAANKQDVTVRQLGERWTSGELFRVHGEVKGLKLKASASDDASLLRKHVYPHIGDRRVALVTEEAIEHAFAAAFAKAREARGAELSQETKRKVYQVTHRLFDLAIKPARLRKDNPVSDDVRPAKGKRRLFNYLYPSELIALLGCTTIPLARRVFYALACYTGLRKGSLKVFTWRAIDFKHLTITSLISKTDLPQLFAQTDPTLPGLQSLIVVLKRYYELQGAPALSALIVSASDLECRARHEAATLREDLQTAGVTRALLFMKESKVVPLRFHDWRATFVTWAFRAGKSTSWISDRTGQLTPEIIDRYKRSAQTLADLTYEPFPDISAAIPELAADLTNVVRLQR